MSRYQTRVRQLTSPLSFRIKYSNTLEQCIGVVSFTVLLWDHLMTLADEVCEPLYSYCTLHWLTCWRFQVDYVWKQSKGPRQCRHVRLLTCQLILNISCQSSICSFSIDIWCLLDSLLTFLVRLPEHLSPTWLQLIFCLAYNLQSWSIDVSQPERHILHWLTNDIIDMVSHPCRGWWNIQLNVYFWPQVWYRFCIQMCGLRTVRGSNGSHWNRGCCPHDAFKVSSFGQAECLSERWLVQLEFMLCTKIAFHQQSLSLLYL